MKYIGSFIAAAIASVLLIATAASAATYNVTPGGTGTSSLQGALNAAASSSSNDTIYMASGTYTGSFNYYNTSNAGSLTVSGAPGTDPEDVVIDANGGSYGIRVRSTYYSYYGCAAGIVQGITVTGQVGGSSGLGGIVVQASGGQNCRAQVSNCILKENDQGIYASGRGQQTVVQNNVVMGNRYNGIYVVPGSQSGTTSYVKIHNNLILKNGQTGTYGVGLLITQSYYVRTYISNNTFSRNKTFGAWTQLNNYADTSSYVYFYNNLFYQTGTDIFLEYYKEYGSPAQLYGRYYAYNNTYGNVATGQLTSRFYSPTVWDIESGKSSSDPQFVDAGPTGFGDYGYSYDYNLNFGSPAVDSGDGGVPYLPSTDLEGKPRVTDGDGNGSDVVDRGAYERGAYVNPDIDGDGIANAIDGYMGLGWISQSGLVSFRFDDRNEGGSTFGTIQDVGNIAITVEDDPTPGGVRISAQSDGGIDGTEVIELCDFFAGTELELEAGDDVFVKCSSVITEVISGPVTLAVGDVTIEAPTGAQFMMDENAQGYLWIENDQASTANITVTKQGQDPIILEPANDVNDLPPAPDSDGDGYLDTVDECDDDVDKYEAGQCGCGVSDYDSDDDGVADCNDQCVNDPAKTEPGACGCGIEDTDSDGDGAPDCVDECPDDQAKTEAGQCGCGVADIDSDSDGTMDCVDNCDSDPNKTEPGVCGCGVSDVDSDNDGTPDCEDSCDNDPDKVAPGVCGCGVADVDSDSDGTMDCNDACPNDPNKVDTPGVCGCGIADVDSDGDGVLDCQDACPNDPDKTLQPGICGCGVADVDSDGDGTYDCNDQCADDPDKTEPGQCGCGASDGDSDQDGTADCNDGCVNDPNKTEAGACGCGSLDTDYNSNGTADCMEDCNNNNIPDICDIAPDAHIDLCGSVCRITDTLSYVQRLIAVDALCGLSEDCDNDLIPDECQSAGNDCNQNEQYDACETDTDGDGVIDDCEECDSDPAKTDPGQCGCGVADTDSDNDDTPDCEDLCPSDSNKVAPGECGCGTADRDENENGVTDCLEEPAECSGECNPEDPTLDEDNDGVANCQELIDETDPCDPGSFLDKLQSWACAGPNSFLGQVNIATVMNQKEQQLKVRAQYRDLHGVEYPAVERTLEAYQKWDLIVNDLGMEANSYGTFCVYTDAEETGAWSGGLAVYKMHEPTRRPRDGFSPGSEFDYALYYPFTAPRRGTSVVSLNTNAINAEGEIADWVRLTDGAPGDGENLAGMLYFYDGDGQVEGTVPVVIPDGGRYDFPGHEALGQNAIGSAVFVPNSDDAQYFIESTRYHYAGAIGRSNELFFSAYPIPVMASAGAEATGRVVSGDNQVAIVEMMNAGDTQAAAQFIAYGATGVGVMSTDVEIPAKGARHMVIDSAGSGAGQANSFGLSPANNALSAVTVVYSMGAAGYEYAYAPALAVSVGSVQFTEHNTFLGHKNKLVLSNAGDDDVNGVAVTVFDLDGSALKVLTVDLAGRATEVIDLDDLPADTYGAIKVDSGASTSIVVRNEIYKEGEYVLIFPGR